MFFLCKNTKIERKTELLFTEIGAQGANLIILISKLGNADLTKCGSLSLSRGSCLKNADTTYCGEQHSTRHPLKKYHAEIDFYLMFGINSIG